MPKETNKRTARQKDADELHATVIPSPTAPPTIVEQSDPSKLKATVTQAAKDRTITGNVGLLTSSDVRINPTEEDGNLASILTQFDITLSSLRDAIRGAGTKDFSTLEADIESIKDTDGIKKITDDVTVVQAVAANHKSEVTQFAKDRTVTNDVNVVQLAQLIPFEYDYMALGYTGANLTSVVYKTGGAGGATVATLTLAYTDSRLDSVTRT